VSLSELIGRIGTRIAHLPTHTKVLLTFAISVLLIELAFRRFGPRSKAYARWTRGVEAVGVVWTAVLLSIVYIVSVGPVSLFMRLAGRDLLDRSRGSAPTFWKPHDPNPLGPLAAARHQF
jgi:branched-subunit amino acid ABC-type transport system permease component